MTQEAPPPLWRSRCTSNANMAFTPAYFIFGTHVNHISINFGQFPTLIGFVAITQP